VLSDVSGITENREDLLVRELVFRLELFHRGSGSQTSKNRRDIDPGSRKARLPEANFGVHRNAREYFHCFLSLALKYYHGLRVIALSGYCFISGALHARNGRDLLPSVYGHHPLPDATKQPARAFARALSLGFSKQAIKLPLIFMAKAWRRGDNDERGFDPLHKMRFRTKSAFWQSIARFCPCTPRVVY
jgi:hypothetical protein